MNRYVRQLERTDFGRPVRSQHDMYVRNTPKVSIPITAITAPALVVPNATWKYKAVQVMRAVGLIALLFALVGASLSTTLSFYQDVEISTGNTLATGGVDFILEDTPFASSTNWFVDVVPEDFSNPFFYVASSSNFSGSMELCTALIVTAYQNDVIMYQGPLSLLRTATSTDLSTWKYDFDNFEAFAGQTCNFDIVYNGWQTRHDYQPGGYSDTETVSYSITVPSMLLTKVYFDYDKGETCFDDTATTTIQSGSIRFALTNSLLPNCADVSPTQEWVEVYNLTTAPIDLSNWQICDGETCDTLPSGHVIAPGKFGLLAERDSIHTEISIPWDVELLLIPDGTIGDGLRTKGDMLQLRNADGLTVDQLNWGEADILWPNSNPMLWPDNSLTATSGQALARLPIAVDTNQPTDWHALGIPAVVLLNPSSTTVSVTPGELVDITWTAHNLNGPDEDLKIDIYWFDPADGLHLIVLDTPNDGLFQWQAPDNLSGNVRIKLVATGPENPLLNTRVITTKIPVMSPRFAVVGLAAETDNLSQEIEKHEATSSPEAGDDENYEEETLLEEEVLLASTTESHQKNKKSDIQLQQPIASTTEVTATPDFSDEEMTEPISSIDEPAETNPLPVKESTPEETGLADTVVSE